MKFKYSIFWLFLTIPCLAFSQNRTDVSLFDKKDPGKQLTEVFSESGDMYLILGHHGPAIENEFLGLRMFFDKKAAIDVYSKSRLGLELKAAAWYPTPEQQADGWGADHYHVGDTVGLGGVRLWDGEKVVPLDPVSGRYGRVVKEGSVSFFEMRSEDVPYKGTEVDILVRVTVFSGVRNAKVEAFALSDQEVQFVTGLNHHEGQELVLEKNYYLSWGASSGGVAAEQIEIGAAVIFNPEDFIERMDDGTQALLISKPCKHLEHWITSANSKESKLNTLQTFRAFVDARSR